MSSEYRPDRRIDPVRRLGAVTRNEAAELTDVLREHTLELERERLSEEYRRSQGGGPKRPFAALLKPKP